MNAQNRSQKVKAELLANGTRFRSKGFLFEVVGHGVDAVGNPMMKLTATAFGGYNQKDVVRLKSHSDIHESFTDLFEATQHPRDKILLDEVYQDFKDEGRVFDDLTKQMLTMTLKKLGVISKLLWCKEAKKVMRYYVGIKRLDDVDLNII